MAIVVYLIYRKYLPEIRRYYSKKIGLIEDVDLVELTKIASKRNLDCLSLVDFVGDTILNQKQIREMQKEVTMLKNDPEVDQAILAIIENGVEESLKISNVYLVFNGE